jgi:transposase InsO family protein
MDPAPPEATAEHPVVVNSGWSGSTGPRSSRSSERETLQGRKSWSGEREARHAVFRWVTRYNTRRRHSSIGQISPIAYEPRSNTLCPMSKAAMPGLQH